MPQLITPIAIYLSAYVGGSIAVWEAVVTIAAVAGSYAIQKNMQKLPDFSSLETSAGAKLKMTRETTAATRTIYGMQKVSGPLLFASTSGPKNSTVDLVIGLAGHECNGANSTYFPAGHMGIYLNDQLAVDTDGTVQSPFVGKVDTLVKLGGTGQSAFNIPGTEWAVDQSTRTLDNITALHVHMIHDPQVFPAGLPNVSVVIEGKKCVDIRNGTSSTPVYTTNPSLILYDYLTTQFGAMEQEIHTASFSSAATICDLPVTNSLGNTESKLYECNYSFLSSEKPSAIIENILKSCYGKLVYANGQFQLKVGYPQVPTVTLTDSDLRGGISITTKASTAQAYNKATGLYVDGNNPTGSFQSAEFVPVTSSFYLAEDNAIESTINLEFPSVTNQKIARRLSKMALIDGRQDLTINYPCKPSGLQLLAGDTVMVKNTRMGWNTGQFANGKMFEVMSLNINPDLSVDLVMKETSNDIFAWSLSDQDVDRDLTINTDFNNPFSVDPIVGFTATNVPTRDGDGTIFPGIQLDWTSPGSASIAKIELDYKQDIEPTYTALATLQPGTTTFTTIDVEAGKTYDFRIRQYNYFGVYSPYASASIVCTGDNTIPQAPTGSAVAGTGSVALTWTYPQPQEADYRHTKITINSVVQGYVAGTTFTKQLSGGGPVTCSLIDYDTSGNASAQSALFYANVAALDSLQSGSAGPTGSKGDYYVDLYKDYDTEPPAPSGINLPIVGWSTTVPNANGSAIWISTGKFFGATDTLSGSWSSPTRFSGNVIWYKTSAQTGSLTPIAGDWVFTTDNRRWWRYSGATWEDAYTQLKLPDFPSDFKPVLLFAGAPTGTATAGTTATDASTGMLYRYDGAAWLPVVTSASYMLGQITSTQIGENSVIAGKIAANSITGSNIIGGSITGNKIEANTITGGLIAAGAITASHIGTNTIITNQANIANAVITSAKIVDLAADKIVAGTITAAVTMSAAYINGGKIDGGGLTVYSAIGIRAKDNSSTLTITGGSDNGANNGAQIDLSGNNAAGGNKGVLTLSAGQGDNSAILFLTNTGTSTTGVVRAQIDTNGLLTVERLASLGGSFTADAGNLRAEGNIAIGNATIQNTNTGQGQLSCVDIMATGDIETTGGSFISPSALKLKDNLRPLRGALDIVNRIHPMIFDWKDGRKNDDCGFIADAVELVIPNVVHKDAHNEVSGMSYDKMTPYLWAAIKEQQTIIENMRLRIVDLERR
jgi:hypothetical protein